VPLSRDKANEGKSQKQACSFSADVCCFSNDGYSVRSYSIKRRFTLHRFLFKSLKTRNYLLMSASIYILPRERGLCAWRNRFAMSIRSSTPVMDSVGREVWGDRPAMWKLHLFSPQRKEKYAWNSMGKKLSMHSCHLITIVVHSSYGFLCFKLDVLLPVTNQQQNHLPGTSWRPHLHSSG